MSILKSLKLRWWILIALTVLVSADCLFRDRWVVSEGEAPAGFARLPGAIGVAFRIRGEMGSFKGVAIESGKISWVNRLPAVHSSAKSGGLSSRPSWLPIRISEYVTDGPAQRSPNGQLVALGASKDGPYPWGWVNYNAPVFLILKLATWEVVVERDSENDWGVNSLAWSPDGQYVAVLRLEADYATCLTEIVTYLAHGTRKNLTYYLDVYNIDGVLVASTKLNSRGHWSGEVSWY